MSIDRVSIDRVNLDGIIVIFLMVIYAPNHPYIYVQIDLLYFYVHNRGVMLWVGDFTHTTDDRDQTT